jgi:hypothetical protein
MAKKVVATLKKEGGVSMTKVIKMVKSESGNYTFEERIVLKDNVNDFFK